VGNGPLATPMYCDASMELGLPDHLKFFRGHFVIIEILLHSYFEYFLDIMVHHNFSKKNIAE